MFAPLPGTWERGRGRGSIGSPGGQARVSTGSNRDGGEEVPIPMTAASDGRQSLLEAIREIAKQLGRPPSRAEFKARSGLSEYAVLKHFPSWRQAVVAAGLEANQSNVRLQDSQLLKDWGELVRKHREIPTRVRYRREGKFSPGVFERHFGPWSSIPRKFRTWATNQPEWSDVLALLPLEFSRTQTPGPTALPLPVSTEHLETPTSTAVHAKIQGQSIYGKPIDFRGLRHEPVNEQGVVFLFGMVALELGYHVEATQAGFPDCEAKRQIAADKWQRVRIEFEFESRNFRDHGHPVDGCDVIVCWKHNWADCPESLEVLDLSNIIKTLARSES